jgi:hypothetical protein
MTWLDFLIIKFLRRYVNMLTRRFSMEHERVFLVRAFTSQPQKIGDKVLGKTGAIRVYFGGDTDRHQLIEVLMTRDQMNVLHSGMKDIMETQDEQYFTYEGDEMIDVNTLWRSHP